MNATVSTWMQRLATWVRLHFLLRPPDQQQVLQLLTVQLQRAGSLHQVLQVDSLAASWLAGHHLQQLRQHLQAHLLTLQQRPASPRNTSSRKKTARRTTKHRR